MNGKLYLCATPIGNLGDVSARCLEAFNNADLIAAENLQMTIPGYCGVLLIVQ